MANYFNYKKLISFKELDNEFNAIVEEIKKFKIPEGFLQFAFYSVAELFANIKEHSKAKRISTKIKVEKGIFSVKISDDGIGFKKSYILKEILPKDDCSAIELALSGLSTKSPKERGYGLYTIRKFVETLGGEMEIKTGKALAVIERKKIRFEDVLKEQKGVTILIKAKIKEIDFYKIVK